MRILVTGSAGFIGSAATLRLLADGNTIIGLDNHNDYYDPLLKEARVARQIGNSSYTHVRGDLADGALVDRLFSDFQPEAVVHLGAQAGVRYSIDHPLAYIESNILGFAHILEGCRKAKVGHLVYASSSSVYGSNSNMPFSVKDNVDHPLNVYAATKKSNEAMAHAYSHLHDLPATGLRFFTVYGPWGRPDMAPFKFIDRMLHDRPIQVYNYGNHRRDFTYIDDIVEGLVRVLHTPAQPSAHWDSGAPDPGSSSAPWRIHNIGSHRPVQLLDFIETIEAALGVSARKQMLPIQPGDLQDTYADVGELIADVGYSPATPLETGVARLVDWYKGFYGYTMPSS